MKKEIQELYVKQLYEIHEEYLKLRKEAIEKSKDPLELMKFLSVGSDSSKPTPYIHSDAYHKLITKTRATIKRIVGSESEYYIRVASLTEDISPSSYFDNLDEVMGVIEALYDDIKAGYLNTLHELIHANLFSNFLLQAEYLMSEGYKDAAVVIAGSTLEQHIRNLCEKHSIEIKKLKGDNLVPKGINELKDELAKNKIIPSNDINLITSWIQIRNRAAHGEYDHYSIEDVKLMIQGIKLILSKYLA